MRVVIFANGILPDVEAAKNLLRPDDFLLGVDGGARLIMQMGLMPNLVMGDLDSLDENDAYELGLADVRTHQYPRDKDETDLELALQYALELNPASILVVAALGGRIDQTLANIALLTDSLLSHVNIRLDDGVEEVFFCRSQAQIAGSVDDTVSLIPWNVEVRGVVTTGLQWQLNGETLFPYKTRGISNAMIEDTATVKISEGLLLIVRRRAGNQ